jgi:hypothetical protein
MSTGLPAERLNLNGQHLISIWQLHTLIIVKDAAAIWPKNQFLKLYLRGYQVLFLCPIRSSKDVPANVCLTMKHEIKNKGSSQPGWSDPNSISAY